MHLYPPDSRWDWFFLALLAGLLALLLFSLGAVEAWSELVVVCAAAVLAVGLLLRTWLDASFRLARSWTYLPLIAILGLIVVQLAPLPASLVGAISPKSIELRQELLGDLVLSPTESTAEATSGPTDPTHTTPTTTLSLYPYETSHDLRMALIFVALFFAAASLFRSAEQIERVLMIVFVIGCVEAGIALLQIITLSTKIHWMYAQREQVVTAGSFMNYNHLCQFVNLALGAGIALLLVRMRKDSRRGRGGASRLTDLRGARYLRPISGIVLCVVAVLTSMSRNGGISLLVAAGVIGVLLYRRGVVSVRGWLMGMVPLCVIVVLFLTCFDMVYDRFATFDDGRDVADRLETAAGVLRAWRDFSLLGSGLGTHEYIFPLYDSMVIAKMAEHADNDWAQLLEEFGLFGAGAVLAFVLSIFWVAGKLMFRGQTALSTAAFGLSTGLLATAWHSFSDFGQHLPGVFSLTAVVSGLVVAIARYEYLSTGHAKLQKTDHTGDHKTGEPSTFSSVTAVGSQYRYRLSVPYVLGAAATMGMLLLVCWWAISGAVAAYRGEAWGNVALGFEQRLQSDDWQGSDQDFVDLLTAAAGAVEAEPTNVKNGYLLNLYRWRSISRGYDPETGSILLDSGVLPFVSQIAEEIARLRRICPIYGLPYSLEGELRLRVLHEAAGSQLINQAARLTPFDVATCFLAGQLAAEEGRLEEAILLLNRTVTLERDVTLKREQFKMVASVYLDELERVDLAQALAGDDYRRMAELAQLLEARLEESEPEKTQAQDARPQDLPDREQANNYAELAQELRDRALLRLRELVAAGEATASEMARLAAVEMRGNRPAAAVDLYRRALAQDYSHIGWRLALARALVTAGEADEAMREARIVLRLKPKSRAAIALIEQISVLPVERGGE